MGSSLLCLLTYTFRNKSTSQIILNYKQKIVHVKVSTEHFMNTLLMLEPLLQLHSTSFIIYVYNVQ